MGPGTIYGRSNASRRRVWSRNSLPGAKIAVRAAARDAAGRVAAGANARCACQVSPAPFAARSPIATLRTSDFRSKCTGPSMPAPVLSICPAPPCNKPPWRRAYRMALIRRDLSMRRPVRSAHGLRALVKAPRSRWSPSSPWRSGSAPTARSPCRMQTLRSRAGSQGTSPPCSRVSVPRLLLAALGLYGVSASRCRRVKA